MNAPHPRLRDRLCVAGFLVVWLLPLAWHAVRRAPLPGEPALLHNWHDIACLFPNRPPLWNSFYVEVLRAGRSTWEQLDETLDFRLEPFGHRTRLHRYLVRWGSGAAKGREEVAVYLEASDRARHPDRPRIVALRFVWTKFVPDPSEPARGAWQRPPLLGVPATERKILSVHNFTPEAP